ncbi:MAG: hypothetical protein ACRDN9_21040 [Streptosporangiaceae bacterium]
MSSDAHASDPVGSLTEEAAKLVRALTAAGDQRPGGAQRSGEEGPPVGANARSHDPSNCSYCPICQAIGFVRETSPETLEHLGASLASLTAAARGLVEAVGAHAQPAAASRDSDVQNIDLSDDEAWGDG